jgi:hypothetical protein
MDRRNQNTVLSTFALSTIMFLLVVTTAFTSASAYTGTANNQGWIDTFDMTKCDFSDTGENDYFVLQPGYQLTLEGEEDGADVKLVITVLNDTKVVNGVTTRVVEERESEDGELIEVSRNYFAVCEPDNDIFYFGEEVDVYEDGNISHEGAWLAGEDDARAGVIVPADPKVGDKYYQELAPDVAEDRAEVVSLTETLNTPAGNFEDVLKVEETTPLEPGVKEFKLHAPGIGLIQDDVLKLTKYAIPAAEPGEPILKPVPLSVSVGGSMVKVDMNSSSTVSQFRVDSNNKRVMFEVEGEAGTEGTTEVAIGSVLEGPYTVAIDGQPTTDFEVSGSIMTLHYTHSLHDVAITGTNVVPEFPISMIGLVAGIIGILIVLGRGNITRFPSRT